MNIDRKCILRHSLGKILNCNSRRNPTSLHKKKLNQNRLSMKERKLGCRYDLVYKINARKQWSNVMGFWIKRTDYQ